MDRKPSFWDGSGGKIVALVVFLAAAAALIYQDYDVLGPQTIETMTADPGALKLQDCIDRRGALFDKAVTDGLMTPDQAREARANLIPVCQAEVSRA